ncbi:Probable methyltransferase TCM_000168 [Linum perenne]
MTTVEEEESKEIQRVLHMKGGLGEGSYAHNSKIQSAYLSKAVPVLDQAVLDFCDANLPFVGSINIADLGCSSGPNSLFAVAQITSIITRSCSRFGRPPPEFSVFLNDLPGNDFNAIFVSLPAFQAKLKAEHGLIGHCFVSGVPGSFYGRLFPSNSLHLVHSGQCLHWLSQVPPELTDKLNPLINKGKVFISKTSSPAVIEAYKSQFQRDFSAFLAARSKEVIPGGRMVFQFKGRRIEDPAPDESCLLWDYLGLAFQELVSEGVIAEEKLDSYNTPYYEPYTEEVRGEVEREGSFAVERLETMVIPFDGCNGGMEKRDREITAMNTGKSIRAVNESMIRSHFGGEVGGGVLDVLFQRFCRIMAADSKEIEHVSIVVSLVRK